MQGCHQAIVSLCRARVIIMQECHYAGLLSGSNVIMQGHHPAVVSLCKVIIWQ